MLSGECAVAPSTPKPPARLTAATTSRQWLKASSGNSMPSMSQIGDFMAAFTPIPQLEAAFLALYDECRKTLAHRGSGCQARQIRPERREFRPAKSCDLCGLFCLLRIPTRL